MKEEEPFTHVGKHIVLQISMLACQATLLLLALRLHIYQSVCEYRKGHIVYLNSFSGDATTEFPSTLQMARGEVCYIWLNLK